MTINAANGRMAGFGTAPCLLAPWALAKPMAWGDALLMGGESDKNHWPVFK